MNPKKAVRQIIPKSGVKLAEKSYRRARGKIWQTYYGNSAAKLEIIAVTGTNGKTTTCSYINSVLRAAGHKTAVYTTAFFEIDGQRVANHTHMTVASQKSVQKFFAQAYRAGVNYVVIEITSHALDQRRIAMPKVKLGVMTNLTQDHLDYHGTMEEYAAAKARLFSSEYRADYAILNSDDDWYDFFANNSSAPVIGYGMAAGSIIRLNKHNSSAAGSDFEVVIDSKKHRFHTSLLGKFNIYNSLAAIGVARQLGINIDDVQKGIAELKAVPGRMEQIDEGQGFNVLVDFAYTPDALENALRTLRPLTKGNLAIVFGATGDRDKTKRPLMGKVVGQLADKIYLTDDETYTEDPTAIWQAVYEGIKTVNATKKTEVIDDRLKAIKLAFKQAKKGDTILLTGIGHENYRNMGGQKMRWDERQIAKKELKKLAL